MKTSLCVLGIVCLSVSGRAQETNAGETMDRLSRSAEQQLAASVEALDKLREQIAGEKLPLAQELTATEEKLTQLRREHDRVTREVDEGNLEISSIKADIKIRQDELSYLGNLLDEYARTFESKINVSELQY